MLISLSLIVATLTAILLLAFLWRYECRRQGVVLKPYIFWFPALLGLIAVVVFLGIGMQQGTLQLLQDIHDYRPQADRLIAGDKLDSLDGEKLPLLGLIHALQSRLMQHPSAPGWAALSELYEQLTRQTGLDAREMAVKAAERAAKLNPQDIHAQLLLAQTLIAASDDKLDARAETLLDKVLAAHPDYDGARLMLAMAAVHAGRYDVAESAFATLLKHHPDDKATTLLRKSLAKVQDQEKRAVHFASITVDVVRAVNSQLQTGGTLFVFVKQPEASGRPLAAKQVLLDHLPMTIQLTSGDWLGDMPPVGTTLEVGVRYAQGAAAKVADSRVLATVPLEDKAGHLGARVVLH
jgi:cytochrome c-type biogenesis protein CcmH/NrfG